jgi:hypothetical protein
VVRVSCHASTIVIVQCRDTIVAAYYL